MQQLIFNIGKLVNVRAQSHVLRGKELADLPILENAFLLIENGLIKDFGLMNEKKYEWAQNSIDAGGAMILPTWCDSHTHLVFAAAREEEFVDKIKGLSYAEIAAKGGGIISSTNAVNSMSEEALYELAWKRLHEVIQLGTGAMEIKSGYGLSLAGELKMLRVIKRLKQNAPIPVKTTFLGAHAFPLAYKNNREAYIQLVIQQMLPQIANENLADFIDVFCEEKFFTVEETIRICKAGIEHGLQPKIHANQLSNSGAVQAGVQLGAVSVDHLEMMDEAAVFSLAQSSTIGTLLPTAAFFLRMPFPPARRMIDAGCAIALATDYNPGSSPSGNMNLVVAMSCIGMKMLPEEAINAATINGAFAMNLGDELGSIAIGKKANFIFMKKEVRSIAYIPYAFGSNLIDKVMIAGRFV